MQLSFALPTSGSWATPANIREIAQSADAGGFRGLWTFQRLLYPSGTDMHAAYRSVLDPVVALGFAAAVTTRARLGTAILNAPFYAPAVLAKQVAALDVLSDGRLDLGLGLGWNEAEYAAVGVPQQRRGRRFDEYLDCLDVLLTGGPAGFEGEFYRVPESEVLPRPVQPRVPLLLGGSSLPAYRRAGRRADGWISRSRARVEDIAEAARAIRQSADEAGRAMPRVVVRYAATGTPDQIEADIEQYREAGADELFLDLNFDSEHVGNPDADPDVAMDRARAVLDRFSAP